MAKMFMTMLEVQAALKTGEEGIRQYAREGYLREFRDGSRLMYKADQVEELATQKGIDPKSFPKPPTLFDTFKQAVSRKQKTEPTVTEKAVRIVYTNWKGETGIRNITPISIWWGATEYHKEEQYLLKAYDLDKDAVRDFAMKDIRSWF